MPCDSYSKSTPKVVCPKHYEKQVLIAAILGSSMAFLDATVINVALPALQTTFFATISQIQWVVEAYALTLAALLLVGGVLGDMYGYRKIFMLGVFIFTAASIWCGFSFSIFELITARAIQGIGAALMVPGSLALISAVFTEDTRGNAFGAWSGFTAITAAIGPLLGGWLIQHFSWRYIFFLNMPIAIIIFILLLHVPEINAKKQTIRFDFLGAILATLSLGAIVFGLIEWEIGGFIVALFEIIGVLAFVAFIVVEKYVQSPMVPLEIFNSRNFTGTNLITVFLYFALSGVMFFLPLYLIQVQDYTPTETGAALLPMILLIFLLSPISGGLIKTIGAKIALVVGTAIATVGFALLLLPQSYSYWLSLFPGIFVLGLGMGICIAPLTTLVMTSIGEERAGIASGVNNAVARVAGLLAVAVFGLIMTLVFNHTLAKELKNNNVPPSIQENIYNQRNKLAAIETNNNNAVRAIKTSFHTGYQIIIMLATALGFISFLNAIFFIEKQSLIRSKLPKQTRVKK